jgi:multiple sugar transport system ATP-binding protein
MARILFENVSKKFGEIYAVRDFNLEIGDREFVVFVGPSGCGKSTTLRMVAGLEEISEGKLYIGERLVNNVAPKDRDIAMVFQSYALYPHMNVYRNMAFGLELRKLPRAEIDERVNQAARILGLENLLERKPKALSGGQRQRVAMGRAIVRKPNVFLFDEPLSNLDAKLRVQTRAEVAKLHQRLQTTIIYVTHDQVEAMTLANRIVLMKDGRIQQVGSPQDLYETPANLFVASFIGSPAMNFFPCKAVQGDGGLVLDAASFKVPVPAEWQTALAAHVGRDVKLGVRPEHVEFLSVNEPPPGEALQGTVEVIEFHGSESYLFVSQGQHLLLFRTDPKVQVKIGEQVYFRFQMERAHLFEEKTEQRIGATTRSGA